MRYQEQRGTPARGAAATRSERGGPLCDGVPFDIIAAVQRQRLNSKAVLSAGYDESRRELELEFQSGHVYRYDDVPASVFEWLLRVQNKGSFVRRMIAGRYVERAVEAAPAEPASAELKARPAPPSLEEALRASLERLLGPRR